MKNCKNKITEYKKQSENSNVNNTEEAFSCIEHCFCDCNECFDYCCCCDNCCPCCG